MSALDNSRHERFAQEVAKGGPAGRAYEAAGYAARGDSADQAASRLLGNVKVAERVRELQAASADEAVITAADVLRGLRAEAENTTGASGAARVSAWKALGMHLGMFGPKGTEEDPVHNVTRVVGWPAKGDDAAA